MSTSTEEAELTNTGEFDKLKFSLDMTFIEGDIILRKGHTAIVVETASSTWSQIPKWVAAAKQYCNVYSSNSTKSALLSAWPHLGVGNLVDVCDEDINFYYVRIAGKYFGFVEKEFLTTPQPEPVPAPSQDPEPSFQKMSGLVTTALYTRVAPKSTAIFCDFDRNDGRGVRHVLQKGEKVDIIAEENGWYQLEIKGVNAVWQPWSSGKYITQLKPREPQVGDAINFIGKNLYTSSYSAARPGGASQFSGKITRIVNNAHPYLVMADNKAYSGWCDREDFELV